MPTLATKTRALLGIAVPTELDHVAGAVNDSRRILELPDNWDDEGSPAYSLDTWERAARFLLQSAVVLFKKRRIVTPAPTISHGPKGSIDIYWRTSSFTLLINVPCRANQVIDYYGCKPTGTEVKGKLDPNLANQWLLMWMTE